MGQTDALGRTWDAASSAASARLVRRFEADWKASACGATRPDPRAYLPDDPEEQPGAWLALLRSEMNLRWEARESVLVESFRARYPDLDDQILVALLYEEFCLREESGHAPDPAEYDRRFPDLSSRLRRVLEIHDLVGGSGSVPPTASMAGTSVSQSSGPDFPEAGETIGGFRLVEELGRGSFSRVFLARERQLADRPVALKVARTGSREPETLARLQHTHIVPVHSYLIDRGTGLHLLCMPYFGRVTLAMILGDPALADASRGSDLLAALDRLEVGVERNTPGAGADSAGRRALAARPYAGAIAWWGARLAEALQHAHDRGVLHRDLKPSNVLVTADGMPMLLDFNLAQSLYLEETDGTGGKLGGTLAYMAPEHLEALADNLDDGGDQRADLFSLGVVLCEALTNRRPFGAPREARSIPEALLRAAEERRRTPPTLERQGRPLSPALDAILRRCLAPNPEDRYGSASDLAEDLQAFADDGPLRHARVPQPHRAVRWLRRHRSDFAVAAPVVAAVGLIASGFHDRQLDLEARRTKIRETVREARIDEMADKMEAAIWRYNAIIPLGEGIKELEEEISDARRRKLLAMETRDWRLRADSVVDQADRLTYRLLHFLDDRTEPGPAVAEVLDIFYVRSNPKWQATAHFTNQLEENRRQKLAGAVDQLLFLWLAHELMRQGGPGRDTPHVRELGEQALQALPENDPRRGPWRAMLNLARSMSEPSGEGVAEGVEEPEPGERLRADAEWSAAAPEVRASAAFLWGIEHRVRYMRRGEAADQLRAVAWLEQACREQPDHYWSRFCLSVFSIELGRLDAAIEHADVVVALRPSDCWARYNRAEAYRRRGELGPARSDLELALANPPEVDDGDFPSRIRLNLGLICEGMGDVRQAAELFGTVVERAIDPRIARAGRLNLALLDTRLGELDRAERTFDELLEEDSGFVPARWGRVELQMKRGRFGRALEDLDYLVQNHEVKPEWLSLRARALLQMGRAEEALEDAERAEGAAPSAAARRLSFRARLAARVATEVSADDPSWLDQLPLSGGRLAADLRAVAEALRGLAAPSSVLTRAVLLAAAGDPAAWDEASRAVAQRPDASEPLLVRARLWLRAGDAAACREDADRGLALEPGEPRLWAIRGAASVALGQPREALANLDRALALGFDGPEVRASRARAEAALGRTRTALAEWSHAIDLDPDDPLLRLERFRLLSTLGAFDLASQDLEQAARNAADRPDLTLAVALAFLRRADGDAVRLSRGLALLRDASEYFLQTCSRPTLSVSLDRVDAFDLGRREEARSHAPADVFGLVEPFGMTRRAEPAACQR